MRGMREAGFALLIVLWSLVLLSLILAQVLSAGRTEAQLAANLRAAAVAEAVADGAVQDTIFHLLDASSRRWPLQGRHRLMLAAGVAEVTVENIAGKINPNSATEPLLTAALRLCGASTTAAGVITQAILVWRSAPATPDISANAYRAAGLGYAPPDAPFETAEEVGLVLGMTPKLRECLLPHLSVFQENDAPAPAAADPFVKAALTMAAQMTGETLASDAGPAGNPTVTITAVATGHGDGRFIRRATVRLGAGTGRPFRILSWN
jgi:general secretion pathway protein K